jgi:hypothetical protein
MRKTDRSFMKNGASGVMDGQVPEMVPLLTG